MEVDDIKKFVYESIRLGWKWKRIHLAGGEPTVHPKLFEIFEQLEVYSKWNPEVKLVLNTNGTQPFERIEDSIPSYIKIENSKKTSVEAPHVNFNIAPIDTEEGFDYNIAKKCWIRKRCGIGLSRLGYYLCPVAYAMDRVKFEDHAIKTLSEVNRKTLNSQINTFCNICGHYGETSYENQEQQHEEVQEDVFSPTWKKIYETYSERKKIKDT
jgi:hypothetical protein